MDINELTQAQQLVEAQYNNLRDPLWVSTELNRLKGKYDILDEIIKKEQEKVSDATIKSQAEPKPNSYKHKRE